MVGFLDKQHLMSSGGLGVMAEDYDAVTLKDGSVILAYFGSSTGPLNFYKYDAGKGTTEFLSSIGSIGAGYADPNLIANDDGGFSVIMRTETGFLTTDKHVTKIDFTKSAVETGRTDLASGFVENIEATDTGAGYFVSYRDRTAGAETEYVGAFYNGNDKLLNTVDFDAGRAGPFARAEPSATLLGNGNVAVAWNLSDSDGTFVRVFKANGSPVSKAVKISGDDASGLLSKQPAMATNPNGGFVVLTNQTTDPLALTIQRFTNSGKEIGKPITIDGTVDTTFPSVQEPKIAFTKGGLMVVAWTSNGLSNDNYDDDVFISVVSPSGKLIAGPLLANEIASDSQESVGFVTLKNGKLLMTFADDFNIWLSHQSSIQARIISDPDSVWEGNGRGNGKAGGNGDDVMLGLGGKDKLSGGKGADYLKGGNGNDTLKGGDGADVLEGGDGKDKIDGGKGADRIFGNDGNDILKGAAGADYMDGGDGKDKMIGGGDDDEMSGGAGNDKMFGGTGNDTMSATSGKNLMKGGAGDDELTGGESVDRLRGEDGNDVLDGGAGRDKLYGGDGWDVLRGGDGNDMLRGEDGNDSLNGGSGNDKEYGGAGDDTLYESDGNDMMWGNEGADTFRFLSQEFGKDRIKDFEAGVDTLDLSVLANALEFAGLDEIKVNETDAGVRYVVDADNWVLVEGVTLAQIEGDVIL